MDKTYKGLLVLASLIVVTLVCYYPSMMAPLYLDDENVLNAARHLHQPAGFLNAFQMRVIGLASFVLPGQSINDLPSLHLFNLVIHSINAFLVFILAKNLKVDTSLALIVAIIWALHPLNSQAVVYLAQRYTLVCAFFSLLSINLFLQLLNKESFNYADITRLILLVVFCILAMLSKQTAVYLPVALIIVYLFNRYDVKKVSVSLMILIACVLGFLYFKDLLHVVDKLSRETLSYDRLTYFSTQLKIILIYLSKIVLPVELSLEKTVTIVSFNTPQFYRYLIINLILFLAFIFYGYFKNDKRIYVLIFLLLGSLSVESSFIPIEDLYFEHRMYLPSVFVLLLIFIPLGGLFSKNNAKKVTYTSFAIVSLLCLYLSHSRAELWVNKHDFYENEYKLNPNNPRVLFELALFERQKNNLNEALVLARKAFDQELNNNKVTITGVETLLNLMIENEDYNEIIVLSHRLLPKFVSTPKLTSVLLSRGGRAYAVLGQCDIAKGWSTTALKRNTENSFAKDTLKNYCNEN